MTIGTLQQRISRLPPRALDAGIVAAVALAVTLTISVATEEDATRSPDTLAYGLGLTVAALLLARRRWPIGVLIGSIGALFVYYGLEYPAFSPAVPLAAATYYAALAGHIRSAAALLAGVLVFGVGWQTVGEHASLASVIGLGTLADAALLAAVLLLGETVRTRRAWTEEVRGRLQRAEEDREREAARRVAQERLRIAHELHDVLAHTVAGLNVQAGVAADAIDDDPEQAKTSLQTIREQSRAAMAEIRAAVGLLRDGTTDAPRTPAPGLDQLGSLLHTVGDAGVQVEVSVAGTARPLPAAIELTAYRIVQESLTNVVRHAHASTANVLIRYDPDTIVVEVDDDGTGPVTARNGAAGYGLVGMRERAAAVSGVVEAGPRMGGGFHVHAELPTA